MTMVQEFTTCANCIDFLFQWQLLCYKLHSKFYYNASCITKTKKNKKNIACKLSKTKKNTKNNKQTKDICNAGKNRKI